MVRNQLSSLLCCPTACVVVRFRVLTKWWWQSEVRCHQRYMFTFKLSIIRFRASLLVVSLSRECVVLIQYMYCGDSGDVGSLQPIAMAGTVS
jgi:hypothetical protein